MRATGATSAFGLAFFVCLLLPACVSPISERRGRMLAFAELIWQSPAQAFREPPFVPLAYAETIPDFTAIERDLFREVEQPSWRDPEYLTTVFVGAFSVLARQRRSIKITGEAEVLREQAGKYLKQADASLEPLSDFHIRVHYAFALFAVADGQHGKAIADLQSLETGLKAGRQRGSDYSQMLLDDALSLVYYAAGYLAKARGQRNGFSKLAERAESPASKSYPETAAHSLIQARLHAMNELALACRWEREADRSASAKSLKEKKKEIIPIIDEYLPEASRFVAHFQVATDIAACGEGQTAVKLLHDWRVKTQLERGTPYLSTNEAIAWDCALGEVYAGLESYGDAQQRLDHCIRRRKQPDPALDQLAGLVHERQGNLVSAKAAYDRSIEQFEVLRKSYPPGARAYFFNSRALQSYHGLLRLALPKPAQASLGGKDTEEVSEQDMDRLLALSEQTRARQLREELEQPSHDKERSISTRRLRDLLATDELLLIHIVTDQEIILLTLTKERAAVKRLAWTEKKIGDELKDVREMLTTVQRFEDRAKLEQKLQTLSTALLPAGGLGGKRTVLLISDNPISSIPFDVLSSSQHEYRPLVYDAAVETTLSLKLWIASREQARQQAVTAAAQPRQPLLLLALGNPPSRQPGLPQLRSMWNEVTTVSTFFSGPTIFDDPERCSAGLNCILRDDSARKAWLLAGEHYQYDVLHFATHGIVPEPERNADLDLGLNEPALLLAAESNAGKDPRDELLVESEVARRLRIKARLVVLAACHTGIAVDAPHGEGALSMARAFLLKSQAVLFTLWAVQSEQTAELMRNFYSAYVHDGLPPARALQQAKLRLLSKSQDRACQTLRPRSQPVFSDAPAAACMHPYFWSGFAVMVR